MKNFLIICFTLCCHSSWATNYYVAKDGADNNPGNESAPFLTIGKASAVMVAGDTCFIKAGTYREVLQPRNHGQVNKPIVYSNYQQDTVLISATEPLTSWTPFKDDIYQASYTMTLERQNMVYVDGKPMDLARWPNNVDHNPYSVEAISVTSGTASTLQSSEITATNWANGYVWYLGAHSGTSWTRRITNSKAGEITFVGVDVNKWPFHPHNPTVFRNDNRGQFYLFGVLEALDYPEEWYYDGSSRTVYLQAPRNADPNELDVEVGARPRSIFLNKDYIHIDGIDAFGGNVEITGKHCIVRNGTFTNCLHTLDEFDNSDAQISKGVIHVRASHTIVEHNVIDGSSISGIFVQGWNNVTNPTIRHNLIKNCNTIGIHSSPIRSGASNAQIISNTIHTTGRDGIYCSGFNNEIAYNDIYDCMKINNDGGLFYTVGTMEERNMEIHHNWFHDSEGPAYADGRAAGIYLDNDSKGFSVHHNVVWNITWSGVQMNWDIWDNDIYHNTLWNVSQAMGTWLKPEHSMQRIRVYNNASNMEDWIGNDIQDNIIQSTAPFVDLMTQNFVPLANSSLVDAGRLIPGINDDFQGEMPDVGAYEYGLSPWIPGVNTVLGGELLTSADVAAGHEPDVSMYPNPIQGDVLSIHFPSNHALKRITVFDPKGTLILQKESRSAHILLEAASFSAQGIYLIRAEGENLSWARTLIVP